MSDRLRAWGKSFHFTSGPSRAFMEAADEIDRLHEIVERLPKTADGVPVVPGMEVFDSDHPNGGAMYAFTNGINRTTSRKSAEQPFKSDRLYSTRAAAEAARNQGSAQ